MKKQFAILMILSMMLCAVGCQVLENSESGTNSNNAANSGNNMNFEIDPNLESDIKKAYIAYLGPNWDLTEDDLSIDSYGTYNGCTVGYINGPFVYTQALTAEKVGPYIFQYSDSQQMKAYKDGQIITMAEAYKLDWLDDNAVKQIHEKHKQEYSYVYEEADN